MKLPKTRLSTAMSGSARETEQRLRSLFARHRRPALALVLAVGFAIGLCGSLVACRSAAPAVEEPAFTLTQPGEESGPFTDLLGFSGTVIHTISEEKLHTYSYQVRLEDGTDFLLAETATPLCPLDLDGDGAVDALLDNTFYLQVYRYWPDGSLRAQPLQAAAADLLGLEGEYWVRTELAFQPADQTVVIQVQPYDDVSEREERVPLARLLEYAHGSDLVLTPEGQPLPEGSGLSYVDGLTLDGQGEGDDRLAVRVTGADALTPGSTEIQVTLGTGEVLSWRYPEAANPSIVPLHMTSRARQSLLAALASPGSNYGACSYMVLEVEEGKLVERFRLDGVDSYYVDNSYAETGKNGLDTLRIPELYDKWHSPIWGTAAWDGSAITYTSDGYFTDTYEVDVGGDEPLTLALRCTPPGEDHPSYRWIFYDQVQLLKGDQVLQTITPEEAADDGAPFQGFLIDTPAGGPVDFQDINFDGVEEFGLLCDGTRNACRCWFVWDGEAGQFRHLATLAGDLTLLPGEGLLEERVWNQDWETRTVRTYGYDSLGGLVLQSARPDEN